MVGAPEARSGVVLLASLVLPTFLRPRKLGTFLKIKIKIYQKAPRAGRLSQGPVTLKLIAKFWVCTRDLLEGGHS